MALTGLTARRSALLVALAALPAAGAMASPASALSVRACDTGGSSHVYGLKAFRGARCGSALVISSRLANRFDHPSDFSRPASSGRIAQKDALGRKYTCKWQQGSSGGDIALWACTSGKRVVTWVWRFEAL